MTVADCTKFMESPDLTLVAAPARRPHPLFRAPFIDGPKVNCTIMEVKKKLPAARTVRRAHVLVCLSGDPMYPGGAGVLRLDVPTSAHSPHLPLRRGRTEA